MRGVPAALTKNLRDRRFPGAARHHRERPLPVFAPHPHSESDPHQTSLRISAAMTEKMRTPNPDLATARLTLRAILYPCVADCLPLHVRNRVGSATGERHNMILPIARTGAACEPCGRARMLPLEFPRYLTRSVFPGLHRSRQSDYDRDDNRGSRQCHAIQTNNVVTTAVQKMIPSAVSARSPRVGLRASWTAMKSR